MPPKSLTAPARFAALGLLTLVALTSPAVPGVPGTAHAATSTVVTLSFDDGYKDQYTNARPILQSHNMHGTFHIISGLADQPNYMTRSEIVALASDGNEIGGHTVNHPKLTTLSRNDAKREICNDRVALLNWGLAVKNFAYPYGSSNAATRQIVRDCGYNSGRTTWGITSPGPCGRCVYAGTIPPADLYDMRIVDQIRSNTSLATLKSYVTNAERHGGGWVQLVFHHVCDVCAGTGAARKGYSVSPGTLSDFLDWLGPRSRIGTTVKTVDQVIGGAQQPPVNGPQKPIGPSDDLGG